MKWLYNCQQYIRICVQLQIEHQKMNVDGSVIESPIASKIHKEWMWNNYGGWFMRYQMPIIHLNSYESILQNDKSSARNSHIFDPLWAAILHLKLSDLQRYLRTILYFYVNLLRARFISNFSNSDFFKCNKTFKWEYSLNRHSRIHSDDALECGYCKKMFCTNDSLKQHLRVHTKERPYKCKICNKGFTQASAVKVHLRIHSEDKQYKCKYCSKTFITRQNLMVHERVHTGERPYSCSICNKRYRSKSGLIYHNNKYHHEWWMTFDIFV